MMNPALPVLRYHSYEETAFDSVPILEGLVNGHVVFGILSLLRAEGIKNPDSNMTFDGIAFTIDAVVMPESGRGVAAPIAIVSYLDAYESVKSDNLAKYLRERRKALMNPEESKPVGRPPVPAQPPKVIPEPPAPEPKPAPFVPDSPITMAELILQMAAMQTDFDLRMQVVTKRLAALEAK